MGYLKEIKNSEYAAENIALMNRLNGADRQSVAGYILATQAPQILSVFGNLTMRALEKTGESDDNNTNDSDAAKKQALELERDDLLESIGCQSINDFNGVLNTLAGNITTSQNELTQQKSTYETSKNEYSLKLTELNDQYTSGQIIPEEYSQKLEELKEEEAELQKLEEEIKTKEADLKKLNEDYQDKQTKMQKVVNIQKQIDSIDNGGVQEKASGMKAFTKALEKWQKAGNGDDKKALAQAAIEAFDNMQNNKDITVPQSVIRLYQLYDQDLNSDANGKREDLYKAE